eukprot:3158549-Prymnesium_polylepis.1
MEEAHDHLGETLSHLKHEDEENPGLSPDEHEQHREQLSQQVLEQLSPPPPESASHASHAAPSCARFACSRAPYRSSHPAPLHAHRRHCCRGGWGRWRRRLTCGRRSSTTPTRRRSCTSS